VGSVGGAGAVNVIYGSASRLTATGDQLWHQDRPGITGAPERNDEFGGGLAAGDFNGDDLDDLAVGVAFEDVESVGDAGAVAVIYGSPGRLTATGDQLWHQNRPGITGGAESSDRLGSSLAAGDFNGDGLDDLAIGVAFEDVESVGDAGAVAVIYGSPGRLTATGDQFWHQNRPGITGAAEGGDGFGFPLAAGDFNGDGLDDLAVGVPFEDVESVGNAGAVSVIYGSAGRLTATGDQLWHQDRPGITDRAERFDGFGLFSLV
jgi:hypothetical protein